MTDLLLINPSFVHPDRKTFRLDPVSFFGVTPPLGILYVASNAIKAGYKVDVIDLEAERIPFSRLGKIVKNMNPKTVGIGIASSLFHIAAELSEIIKSGTFDFQHPAPLENIMTDLKKNYPALESLAYLVFVNGKLRPSNFKINNQDELALIPPFAGG